MSVKIAPSILSANFGKINEEMAELEPYVELFHIDVMDGHFVPNITFGAPVMKWFETKLPMDVHLMIENPEKYVEDFVKVGGDRIIVHVEACKDKRAVLQQIKDLGAEAGISIKPKTSVSEIEDVLDMVTQVLVMTVEPGFGGQKFMEDMMPKVTQLRELKPDLDICIDGGINAETAPIAVKAGANILVSGSYIYKSEDRLAAIESLRV